MSALSYVILSNIILCYLILSYLILSSLILSYIILSCYMVPHVNLTFMAPNLFFFSFFLIPLSLIDCVPCSHFSLSLSKSLSLSFTFSLSLSHTHTLHVPFHLISSYFVFPLLLSFSHYLFLGFLAAHLIGQHPDIFKVACMRNPVTDIPGMLSITDIPGNGYSSKTIVLSG